MEPIKTIDNNTAALPCLVCGKELERVTRDGPIQAYGAVMCSTHGNYGSGVYDAYGLNEHIEFNVCDECFADRKDRVFILREIAGLRALATGWFARADAVKPPAYKAYYKWEPETALPEFGAGGGPGRANDEEA